MLCAKAFAPLPLVARKVQLRKVSRCAGKGERSEFTDVFGGRQKKFSGEIEIDMPDWNDECDVVVDGQVVHSTSGTLKEYKQEIWSGNHPFYADRGLGTGVVSADTQVKKFTSKYNDMAALSDLEALLESIQEEDKMREELGLGEMAVVIDKGLNEFKKKKKRRKK